MFDTLRREKGFTLLEMAVALLVAGLMVGGALVILHQAKNRRAMIVTQQNMDQIVQALAVYADSAGRLPCPADPALTNALFGWEWGILNSRINLNLNRPQPGRDGACGGAGQQQCTCRDWSQPPAGGATTPRNKGIVPFLTLGLPAAAAKDGWGNYFTYAVSPVFAQNNDDVDPTMERTDNEDLGDVHVKCLDGSWYDSKDNVDAVKAKFCCAKNGTAAPFDPANDITIMHTDGGAIRPSPGGEFYDDARNADPVNYHAADPADDESAAVGTRDISSAMYPTVTSTDPFLDEAPTPYIESPAFVLISHGINGTGAYWANGTRNLVTGGIPAASANENENADYDNIFVEGPISRGDGVTHFDDIVVWRTQNGILAETGASTCNYP